MSLVSVKGHMSHVSYIHTRHMRHVSYSMSHVSDIDARHMSHVAASHFSIWARRCDVCVDVRCIDTHTYTYRDLDTHI